MSVITVRSSDTFEAVHTSNSDWKDAVRTWAEAGGGIEDEQQLEAFYREVERVNDENPGNVWLMRTLQGIGYVSPARFAADFEDIGSTDVLGEVWMERMSHAEHGYTAAHDDVHGLGHLLVEAVSHLQGFGETPTDQHIRGELIVAMGLLHAGVDLIDRGESRVPDLPSFDWWFGAKESLPTEHTPE